MAKTTWPELWESTLRDDVSALPSLAAISGDQSLRLTERRRRNSRCYIDSPAATRKLLRSLSQTQRGYIIFPLFA
ncbi:hypothetical protein AC762_10665, partial [Streptococcus agalactiae]